MRNVSIFVILVLAGCSSESEPISSEVVIDSKSILGEWRCTSYQIGSGVKFEGPTNSLGAFYESGYIIKEDKSFVPIRHTKNDEWHVVQECKSCLYEFDESARLLTLLEVPVTSDGHYTFKIAFEIVSMTTSKMSIKRAGGVSDVIFYLEK